MKKFIILNCVLVLLVSCSEENNTNLVNYEVSVPMYYQVKNDYCVEASSQMVLHYLGDEVLGWKEKTSLYCDDEQFYIHNYLMNEEGKTFYLEHQHGFPTSLNSLLTKHVNVKYSNIGYLCNYDAFWEYDARVSYELKQNRPMIAVVLDMDGNGNSCLHAVVICGIDYNPDSREVEHYYYNDPFYGENISKTRNKWNTFSCVQNNKYLLMTFDI